MPKKADLDKEAKFIEFFCEGDTQGNAKASCIKAGWDKDKSPSQMGSYLRKKLSNEIRKKNEERIASTSSYAISRLQDMLNSARLVLELGNFNPQTINLNIDDTKQKSDAELMEELAVLVKDMPGFAPKLQEMEEKKSKKIIKTVKKESPKPSLTKH
jgi:hypothetical protein